MVRCSVLTCSLFFVWCSSSECWRFRFSFDRNFRPTAFLLFFSFYNWLILSGLRPLTVAYIRALQRDGRSGG